MGERPKYMAPWIKERDEERWECTLCEVVWPKAEGHKHPKEQRQDRCC